MKKRIIGRILAVGLAALLMLPVVSACKTDEEPDKEPAEAERDMTLPPSVEDVVLPSVPEEPIFFGENYIFSVLDLVKRAKFYLVSGEELDPTELRVTLPDCYFYYSVNIEQLDTSGGAVISDVELLMEYNQADWQGLYDLWYEQGPGAYAAAIEAWEELYYAVESEIPLMYFRSKRSKRMRTVALQRIRSRRLPTRSSGSKRMSFIRPGTCGIIPPHPKRRRY